MANAGFLRIRKSGADFRFLEGGSRLEMKMLARMQRATDITATTAVAHANPREGMMLWRISG